MGTRHPLAADHVYSARPVGQERKRLAAAAESQAGPRPPPASVCPERSSTWGPEPAQRGQCRSVTDVSDHVTPPGLTSVVFDREKDLHGTAQCQTFAEAPVCKT